MSDRKHLGYSLKGNIRGKGEIQIDLYTPRIFSRFIDLALEIDHLYVYLKIQNHSLSKVGYI
jgi:hypothetical protein